MYVEQGRSVSPSKATRQQRPLPASDTGLAQQQHLLLLLRLGSSTCRILPAPAQHPGCNFGRGCESTAASGYGQRHVMRCGEESKIMWCSVAVWGMDFRSAD